jgi:hypothetical protein
MFMSTIKKNLSRGTVLSVCFLSFFQWASLPSAADYIPWDELTANSWIQFLGSEPNMYPVNAADDAGIETAYTISFVQKASGSKARGMNALKFIHGGSTTGHRVSKDKAGSFQITNTGDSNTFTDILLLMAIDADSLDPNFSMTLNLAGQTPYVIDANDFVYYDNPYGRPSGFYSATNPNVEPVTYAFDTAMVTVYGVSGVTSLTPLGGTITVDYAFNDVPAPVVFSVYGYVATDPEPSIYHTNRALIDVNNPTQAVSTFAVTVDGDLNGDLSVDLADFAIMSQQWLTGV